MSIVVRLLAVVATAVLAASGAALPIASAAESREDASGGTESGGAASTGSGEADPTGPLPDPYRGQQWHLERLGLDGGVDGGRVVPDGAGQVVAVLDSGVDLAHPDLLDVLARDEDGAVRGTDLVDGDDEPQDVSGHGTMVAGIVAARSGNGLGVAGVVGPAVRVLPVRVLDDEGRGTTARLAAGIDWAVTAGATVLNLSVESAGVAALRDDPDLRAAVDRALDADVAVVVAAGNGDERAEASGAAGLLVVGATDRDDQRASFSDRGRSDLVMAPGVEIVSTWCRADDRPDQPCDGDTHTYGIADGTSYAAPQVSAIVAMLASTGMSPIRAAERVAATTRDLAEPGPDPTTGRGLVDVAAALGPWPDQPVPATTPTTPASTAPATPAPGPAPLAEIAPASPPRRGIATRLTVVAAILVAVGVVVRGLLVGTAARSRARRDELH